MRVNSGLTRVTPAGELDGGGGGGIRPGVRHYNALIRACERARDWKEAAGVLDLMRLDGVEPDIVSYNTVIR
jgi:pentatricopeptide repeat protein